MSNVIKHEEFIIHLKNCRIKVELSEENSQKHTAYFCSLVSTEQTFEIKVQIRFYSVSFFLSYKKVSLIKMNLLSQMLEAFKLLLISHSTLIN